MTDDRKKVTLGGKDYDIKPIDLGTMREIGLGSATMQSTAPGDVVAKEGAWYDGTFQVLSAALKMKLEDVTKIEGVTIQELVEANKKIFLLTGLVVAKAERPKPGEAAGVATG